MPGHPVLIAAELESLLEAGQLTGLDVTWLPHDAPTPRGDWVALVPLLSRWVGGTELKHLPKLRIVANVAVGYPMWRLLTPFLELNSVTITSGSAEDALRDRAQLYLTPGFNVRPLPGVTVRAGVQLPVSHTRQLDYALHGALVWEF